MKGGESFQLLLLLGALCPLTLANPAHPLSTEGFNDLVQAHSLPGINLENEDAGLTVPEIVTKYGYPMEIHEVTTADDYILTVHRIPYGKTSGPAPNKPVVWLQHGLLCDSSNYIMNNEDKALAYVLVNLGYDVWMGNARGNTYSKGHVTKTTDDLEYWDFSWHEMGKYDVPAVLNHILTTTGQEDLYYVGHSMGTTMFFVAMAVDPSLNSKIKLMSALAPVAYVQYAETPLMLVAPFVDEIEWVLEFFGVGEFLPAGPLMELLGKTVCNVNSPIKDLCSNVLFLIAGYNEDQLNRTAVPIILGHTPSGSSVGAVVHYAQMRNSKIFRQYDHGRTENLKRYGKEEPPAYDISNIKAPVAIYWGDNDWLASTRDVFHLVEQLPNVVRKYRVRHDNYNHLDFLWAKDNHVNLNPQIIEYIQRY